MTLFSAGSSSSTSSTNSSGGDTGFASLEDDRDRLDQRLPEGDALAIFHRLPEPAVAGGEIAAMKAAVAELRRARELSRRSDEISGIFPATDLPDGAFSERAPAERAPARRRGSRAWRLPAAAAALLATTLFFGGAGNRAVQPAVSIASEAAPAPQLAVDGASYLPLVEDFDLRQAELIQIEDDGMSLVVVLAAGSV